MAVRFAWSPIELDDFVSFLAPKLKGGPCLLVQREFDTRLTVFRVTPAGALQAVWRGRLMDEERADQLWQRFRSMYHGRPFLREKFAERSWRKFSRRHVRGTITQLCGAIAQFTPTWLGDGVYAAGWHTRHRAVWTSVGAPFHFWRRRCHAFDDSGSLVMQTLFRQTMFPRGEISAARGWVWDSGLAGGVDLQCRTMGKRSLLRLGDPSPLFDVAYDELDRDSDYNWVWRLASRVNACFCDVTQSS
jgi:hypothetical protein